MIVGIGIDSVNIQRVKKLNDAFINRYYHADEIAEYGRLASAHEDVKACFLASRFAVKEAYAKARGTGFCREVIPNEICTCHDEKGKPAIRLYGETLKSSGGETIHLSITHEEPLASAIVILEGHDVS